MVDRCYNFIRFVKVHVHNVFIYRLRIRPKCLIGVTRCDLRTKVLGHDVSLPVGISPTAMQRMAHPEGELANARGI